MSSSRSLVVTRANAAKPSTKPATASATSARLRPLMGRRYRLRTSIVWDIVTGCREQKTR